MYKYKIFIPMKQINKSTLLINVFLCTISALTIIYTMLILGWKPCPMCLIQQACVLAILFISILTLATGKTYFLNVLLRIIILIVICAGIYVAGEQTYLQYFATIPTPAIDIPSCDAVSNTFIINTTKSIVGSVESCTEIAETISGFSMAVYSLLFFIFLLLVNIKGFFSIISKGKKSTC
jgi:disulfide bond formation protein DsbB